MKKISMSFGPVPTRVWRGLTIVSILLCGWPSTPVFSEQSNQQIEAVSDNSELPVYNPPKRISPRARVGGELRGTEGSDPELVALVPDHVALTIRETPVLNWFLSKQTSHPVHFTLVDSRSIKPVYEAPISSPKEPGVQQIHLKNLGLTLEPDVQYRWYVSIIRNPESPSQDIVAGGIIERCEFSECITGMQPNLTCNGQSVLDNARHGFWYDAMACLCELIDANPSDVPLRRQRAAMLKQVGLHGVAEWDLRSIRTTSR